jgi:proline dehydrogenase
MNQLLRPVDFNDTARAFQAKSDEALRWTYRIYRMIDSPFLTRVGPPLLNLALKLRLPVSGLVKRTLFNVFCGGESLQDSVKSSAYLDQFNVKTILDYAVEGEKTEKGFYATQQEIKAAIIHGGKHREVVFSACKLTGMASFDLMAKLQTGTPLTAAESAAWDRVLQRVNDLAAASAARDLPLFIDAEETWIQEVIDRLVENLMRRYNREKPIIFTTTQHYRHDRLAYLENLIEQSKAEGWYLGIKLVRGAYLEKETNRALEMGYRNPIHPNREATHHDFDTAIKLCIDHIEHVAVCIGTHNERSSLLATQFMAEKGLPPNHPHVWFAQLLGMSDHISFNLADAGFNVAKYVPYGPVRAVIPYLMRRAEENTSVAGLASRETELLRREKSRRGL